MMTWKATFLECVIEVLHTTGLIKTRSYPAKSMYTEHFHGVEFCTSVTQYIYLELHLSEWARLDSLRMLFALFRPSCFLHLFYTCSGMNISVEFLFCFSFLISG